MENGAEFSVSKWKSLNLLKDMWTVYLNASCTLYFILFSMVVHFLFYGILMYFCGKSLIYKT
jgi:hypothetical protein